MTTNTWSMMTGPVLEQSITSYTLNVSHPLYDVKYCQEKELERMPRKPLVLIVEDNEDFQELYGMVATQAGFAVERIRDGGVALDRLETGPVPDLVLLDSILPVAGGEEILGAIRSKEGWEQVPVYMLTADMRVAKKYSYFAPDSPQPDGVIEKGAESIALLRELFQKYKGKED
jgi:CheY-like chemotaxis protein